MTWECHKSSLRVFDEHMFEKEKPSLPLEILLTFCCVNFQLQSFYQHGHVEDTKKNT